MRLPKTVLSLAVAIAVTVAATAPAAAFLDKTRFVGHVGVAYFAFHHWVLKPYQEQRFAEGAPHRTAALVKGGVALLFAVHELRVAEKIAHASNDPLLQKLDAGVSHLVTSFGTVGQKMKAGTLAAGDVDVLKTVTSEVGAAAAAGGSPIKDVPVAIPGT